MKMKSPFFLIPLIILNCFSFTFAQPDSYQPIFHITGQTSTSYIGQDISNCGDQNGYGADELLLSNSDPDEVWMFYGGEYLDTIPDLIFGASYGIVGPILYDDNIRSYDYGSLIICQILNYYSTLYLYDCGSELDTLYDMSFQGTSYNDCFGNKLAIGDVNGDGWNDIITSAENFGSISTGRGKLYVYFGGEDMDNIADFTISEMYNDFGDRLGSGLACGDVNGDGYDDILAMTASPRIAYLFYGGAELDSIPDWSYSQYPNYLNCQCGIIPNLRGDQLAAIVLHETGWYTYLFFGGDPPSNQPDQTLDVGLPIYVGDLNRDNYGDMVGINVNIFKIYYGSPSGAVYGSSVYPPYPPWEIGRCGDVNGDGFTDIGYSSAHPDYYGTMIVYADTTLNSITKFPNSAITSFKLLPNYRNPFNSLTTISFNIIKEENINLNIFDSLGRLVVNLINQKIPSGKHQIIWNAQNFSSGVYFIQLQSENRSETNPIEILR
jgi:hypothetical protein